MLTSDAEWQRLMPVTRAENEAELDAFMRRYREGIVEHWGPEQQAEAAKLYRGPGRARRREAGRQGQGAGAGHVLAEGELLSLVARSLAVADGRTAATARQRRRRRGCAAC